jgi:hypothetical protein
MPRAVSHLVGPSRPWYMTIRIKQVLAAVLALTAAYGGVWAAAFPLSFYQSFPLLDSTCRTWACSAPLTRLAMW